MVHRSNKRTTPPLSSAPSSTSDQEAGSNAARYSQSPTGSPNGALCEHPGVGRRAADPSDTGQWSGLPAIDQLAVSSGGADEPEPLGPTSALSAASSLSTSAAEPASSSFFWMSSVPPPTSSSTPDWSSSSTAPAWACIVAI